MIYRVLIDPGHGGHDPGAVNQINGLRESDVVLSVGLKLHQLIKNRLQGKVESMLSRDDDRFIPVSGRAELANRLQCHLLLSIHCNSAERYTAHGFEVFTSRGQTASDPIATALYNSWQKRFPTRFGRSDFSDNDPDKEAGFSVLTKTAKAAVLFEMAFIHNEAGSDFLSGEDNQNLMALALFEGLCSHLDIAVYHPHPNPSPASTSGFLAITKGQEEPSLLDDLKALIAKHNG